MQPSGGAGCARLAFFSPHRHPKTSGGIFDKPPATPATTGLQRVVHRIAPLLAHKGCGQAQAGRFARVRSGRSDLPERRRAPAAFVANRRADGQSHLCAARSSALQAAWLVLPWSRDPLVKSVHRASAMPAVPNVAILPSRDASMIWHL